MSGHRFPLSAGLLILLLMSAAVVIPMLRRVGGNEADLVIYCAHDAEHAEALIEKFRQVSGLRTEVRYDEEANKSLGLTNLLVAEADAPRCDVFWNNQVLGTIRLQRKGVLAPYRGTNTERIPAAFKDPDGHWIGFAARLRVHIVNTDLMEATESAVAEAWTSSDLSSVCMAQPLFGTTLTHYSVLAAETGFDELKKLHDDVHQRGIREVRGNGATRDLVAEGICRTGWTDTDDSFAAVDRGAPVSMVPVRTPSGATICIPNSVAMIRNCPHPEAAAQFIEFLLSEETELELAQSASRQIPLGPVDESRVPEDVRGLLPWAADGADLTRAADANERVLEWLVSEYTGR